jgi:hypothetical protein
VISDASRAALLEPCVRLLGLVASIDRGGTRYKPVGSRSRYKPVGGHVTPPGCSLDVFHELPFAGVRMAAAQCEELGVA